MLLRTVPIQPQPLQTDPVNATYVKPEHAMDLDTGAVVAAELHPADQGDTTTMPGTLASAAEHLAAVNAAPTPPAPTELIADKGYHSRAGLKELDGGPWKSRISEPHRDAFSRWHGDDAARRAVYNNRTRLLSGVARQAFRLRAELVERGFALILDRGGMRRVWLRGRENVHKRYLIHVAGYNMGLIMRLLTGAGTPREFRVRASVWLFATWEPEAGLIVIMHFTIDDQTAAVTINIRPNLLG
jgi:transposase